MWVNILATMFCARARLIASWTTLANALRFLVEALNPDGSDRLWPDWQLVLDLIRQLHAKSLSSKAEYTASLIQPLDAITRASGDLFCSFRGLDFEDLVLRGRSAVISMPNLMPYWLRHFVLDLIIAKILFGRIHRMDRTDLVNTLVIADEADADCSQAAEAAYADHMAPITAALKTGREFGLGVFLGLSGLGSASRLILNNTAYHWLFALKNEHCVDEARRTLMLPRGGEQILPALDLGECLVRTPDYAHAMLAQIDAVPSCRMKPTSYDTHDYVPAERLRALPDVLAAVNRSLQRRRDGQDAQELSRPARDLLDLISQNPYWPVARLWEKANVKPRPAAQVAAHQELKAAALAEFAEPRIGNANVLIAELTQRGWKFLGKQPHRKGGRGDMSHRHYATWACMVCQRGGRKAHLEWIVPGTTHPTDVGCDVEGGFEVYEIVVNCSANLISHLKACLSSKTVLQVHVVAGQVQELTKLRKMVEESDLSAAALERVDYIPVNVLLRELWPA